MMYEFTIMKPYNCFPTNHLSPPYSKTCILTRANDAFQWSKPALSLQTVKPTRTFIL